MDRKEYIERLTDLRTFACSLYSDSCIGQRLTERLCTWAMMALVAKPIHEEAPHQFITDWTSAETRLCGDIEFLLSLAMEIRVKETLEKLSNLKTKFEGLRLEMLEQVGEDL